MGLKALKKQKVQDARPKRTEDEIKVAVREVHAWLSQKDSALRSLPFILGGSGTMFAAYTAEKTLRGWIGAGGATVDIAQRAALARDSGSSSKVEAQNHDDAAGLDA